MEYGVWRMEDGVVGNEAWDEGVNVQQARDFDCCGDEI